MFVVFDIGGTKMRFSFSEDKLSFSEPIVLKNPKNFKEAMELIREKVSFEGVEKVAGGITGTWNHERTELLRSPNMQDWVGKPIKSELENIFGVPVMIDNDAAVVGLGEAVFGAGKGYNNVVYMTVSTGVGGARIIEGKVDESTIGFEPGHQVIDILEDGKEVTLEDAVSGTAMEKITGKKAYKTPQNDPIWDKLAEKLAIGIRNSIMHWSPEVFVLGGSMIVGDPAISVEKTEKYLKNDLATIPKLPEIKKAQLGDFGGLYGGLSMLN